MARDHGQHSYKGYTISKNPMYGYYTIKKGWKKIDFDGQDRFSLFRDAKAAIDKKMEGTQKMTTYKFTNGDVVSTKLPKEEMLKRMNRLDTLRVMMEGYDEGDGRNICNKAYRAYNKTENFTGIIKLNGAEKNFLSYRLESEFISSEEIEIVRFYCGITDNMWNEIISAEGNEHLVNK